MSEIKPRPNIVDGVKKITPMWKTNTGQRPPVKLELNNHLIEYLLQHQYMTNVLFIMHKDY
jgi:hypothetical protein